MSETTFHHFFETNSETLDLYTTAITRAHGDSHPEAYEVREIFEQIQTEVKGAAEGTVHLDEQFSQLRHVTNDYEVPADVCETYESVYHMLEELDQLYKAI